MIRSIRHASMSVLFALSLATLIHAQTPVTFPDGDFESAPVGLASDFSHDWSGFGNAYFDDNSSVVFDDMGNPFPGDAGDGAGGSAFGFQSVKMFGNFWDADGNGNNWTGVYQDIPVDGTNVSVGDLIQIDGFGMTLGADSVVGTMNDAFLEITYVGEVNPGNGPEEFGFGGARSDNVGNLGADEWHHMFTTGSFVPSEADFVRVKAIFAQSGVNLPAFAGDPGAAWFDNISLNIIPVLGFACDADADGDCDMTDIDMLYAEFGNSGPLDLDGSGTVDVGDITEWLSLASDPSNTAKLNAAHIYMNGDVNLDGSVNSDDLGILLNNFGDTNGLLYGAGNLNGDANVNSDDLGILLNNFGHASLAAAAVPEPQSLSLLIAAMVAIGSCLRRRR